MKIELRTVYCERLPEITMRIGVDPLECLKRIERILRANKSMKVRSSLENDGDLHSNVVCFADRNEAEHEGLFAMFLHWNHYGRSLHLQLAADQWNPDPPTYLVYVQAAQRLLQPIISAYNCKFGLRHRMRIQTREETQPRMTPKAKEAFEQFSLQANKSALHPLDWEAFYNFIYICRRSGLHLLEDEIKWFCRRAGFSPEQSTNLSVVYGHCYSFCGWLRGGR